MSSGRHSSPQTQRKRTNSITPSVPASKLAFVLQPSVYLMTLEQVRFPLAPSASHDPEWRSSYNPSVRTNPYISSGEVQDQCADQKTPFFGEFSISRRLMGPLRGPRDIECGSDYRPKPGSSGNHGLGWVLGPGWGRHEA